MGKLYSYLYIYTRIMYSAHRLRRWKLLPKIFLETSVDRCRPHMKSIKKALVLLDTDTALTCSSLVEACGSQAEHI